MANDTYFDSLKPASFDGISFPVEGVSTVGGYRIHVHEFPHTAGGQIEKLGRRLYRIKMRAFFAKLPGSKLDQLYPDLYPFALYNLRSTFEDGKTGDLVIPTVGTIRAVCTEWPQQMTAMNRSGETAEFDFIEDSENDNLFENKAEFGDGTLATKNDALQIEAASLNPKPTVFDAINSAVNQALAYVGAVEQVNYLVSSKLLWVADLCRTADRTLLELNEPSNWRIVEALKQVQAESLKLATDTAGTKKVLQQYIVTKTMSVTDVAASLYGDASRGVDLIRLNEIPDLYAIPRDTQLVYLADR